MEVHDPEVNFIINWLLKERVWFLVVPHLEKTWRILVKPEFAARLRQQLEEIREPSLEPTNLN